MRRSPWNAAMTLSSSGSIGHSFRTGSIHRRACGWPRCSISTSTTPRSARLFYSATVSISHGASTWTPRRLRSSPGSERSPANVVDPLGNSAPHRTKPLVVTVHGDTWNLGHELYLAGDIRVAAANTRFGQDENTHGRFPGGGATVRFVREAGWGNAMRYMLTGDHWSAEESYRMGITQQIAATPEAALEAAVATARKIAACAPLSIKATLASAHQVIDPIEGDALSKLGAQYSALYRTEDFLEGRRAEAEGRPPKYQGK
jgi:enoyl-CoA hydratase/carnithine racemase